VLQTGHTPLMVAIIGRHVDTALLLMRSRADKEAKNLVGVAVACCNCGHIVLTLMLVLACCCTVLGAGIAHCACDCGPHR
jgi:hypothetical protein